MQSNWRLEPILEFEVETTTGHVWRIKENGELDCVVQYRKDIAFKDVDKEKYWADAVYWYKKAALQNEPLAVKMLQCIADFKLMERKALTGDADAQYYLSAYYFHGYGIYKDPQQGSKWLNHAAMHNNQAAIRSIEKWNKENEFVQAIGDPDFFVAPYFIPECCKQFNMFARHGKIKKEKLSQTHLKVIWESFSNLDFEETELNAIGGNPEKQYQLAWLYDWGLGVKQDMKEAIKWFVEAAFNQYAPAQTELGILYHYGLSATKFRLTLFDGKESLLNHDDEFEKQENRG